MCTSEDAWLGNGYYFWDTFENLAHWWGESVVKKPYMVCKAVCDFSSEVCFDLHGDTEHIALFRSIADVLEDEGLADENITASDVITHLKDVLGIFHWKAVRMMGVNSTSPRRSPNVIRRINVEPNNDKQFLDCNPPIQLCIYDLSALEFKDYEIIYPTRINN